MYILFIHPADRGRTESMNPSKKNRFHEPDLSFFERAYTDSIVPRVMGASAKQRKNHFRQDKFKSKA